MKVVLLIALLTVSGCDGRRVVGQTGQNVTLPCNYDIKTNGAVHVCWGRGEIPNSKCYNQLLSTDGHKVETRASSRYQLLGRLDEGDVSLTILSLTEEDAGRYGCRAEIPGWFNDEKHHVDLTVERAPITWAPSEPQTSSERPAAAQTAADQLTTESLLTSCSNSSSFPEEQEGSMLTLGLVLVVLLLVFLVTAVGLFSMGPEHLVVCDWTRTSCVYQTALESEVNRSIQQLERKMTTEAVYCCRNSELFLTPKG
ncbi:PREDICTED: hepatitis A virus cellular receptor 1 homolog isoform X2 [Poecilia mexicana]|uniref:hepatitis A virus cellular receptor 1 homolog isoform X2 n=1 Tax=Poecilia mexicana TaxID=48701 RepID=UPI00072DEDD3|nr:PREDICTED: hepatitis A virus cellular receptor 1 homolog isoform X2 [Poecilia mexicana]